MPETPLSLSLLYALGDLLQALLVGALLALPLAVPVGIWWYRR